MVLFSDLNPMERIKLIQVTDQPPPNHQQASKQEAQFDSVLEKIRGELGIPAGKKSLKVSLRPYFERGYCSS